MSNANPIKHTKVLCICTLLYLALRKKVESNMMHGIDHDESTRADNTDVFLNANTANTFPGKLNVVNKLN